MEMWFNSRETIKLNKSGHKSSSSQTQQQTCPAFMDCELEIKNMRGKKMQTLSRSLSLSIFLFPYDICTEYKKYTGVGKSRFTVVKKKTRSEKTTTPQFCHTVIWWLLQQQKAACSHFPLWKFLIINLCKRTYIDI